MLTVTEQAVGSALGRPRGLQRLWSGAMSSKARALLIAASLAVPTGQAQAQYADAVAALIDLPTVAEMILDDLLSGPDSPYVLTIGFSLGVAFSSGSVSLAESLSEAFMANGQQQISWSMVESFAESFASPGVVGTSTGVGSIVITLPLPQAVDGNSVSPD